MGVEHERGGGAVDVEEAYGVQVLLSVDLDGALCCAQAAGRRMVAAGLGGRIINVTSVHEHVPLEGAAAYCAAKGGLGALTKVMALELARHGITVNSVAPGEIATPMTGNDDVDPATVRREGAVLARDRWDDVMAVWAQVSKDRAGRV